MTEALKLNLFPQQRDPAPPQYLGKAGRRLWKSTLRGFHLDATAMETLAIACRQMDVAEGARERMRIDGMIIHGARGGKVKHPALVAERDAHALYLAAMRQLGLDAIMSRPGPGRPPGGR